MNKHSNTPANPLDDRQLAALLKQGAHQARPNQWFTSRVMHRLPAKQRSSLGWLVPATWALSGVALIACWLLYFASAPRDVVTNGSLLHFVMLLMLTLGLGIAIVAQVIHDSK